MIPRLLQIKKMRPKAHFEAGVKATA